MDITIEKLQIPLAELIKHNQLATSKKSRQMKHSKKLIYVTNHTMDVLTTLVDCEPHRAREIELKLSLDSGKMSRVCEQLIKIHAVEKYKQDIHSSYYRITEKGLTFYNLFKDDLSEKKE